jgi:hypothetical protein
MGGSPAHVDFLTSYNRSDRAWGSGSPGSWRWPAIPRCCRPATPAGWRVLPSGGHPTDQADHRDGLFCALRRAFGKAEWQGGVAKARPATTYNWFSSALGIMTRQVWIHPEMPPLADATTSNKATDYDCRVVE